MFVRFIFVRFICVSAFCGFVSVLFTLPLSVALAQEDGAGPIPIAEETPGNSGGDGLPPFALPMGEGGPVLSLHGFARVDYAAGDRFGDDVFGVSKAALDFGVSMDNLSANIVLGTGDLTGNTPGDINGNVFIPDAFFTWTDIGGSGLTVSGGRRPILFGLKPAGFPGDHSLQASVEYGAGGNFAVSNQAGSSLIAHYETGTGFRIEAGVLDTDATTPDGTDGSSLVDTYFIQLRAENPAGLGFYGVAGFENRYVAATDSSESIFDIGIGWQNEMLDLSFEYIELDNAIAGTANDETYLVAEAMVFLSKEFSAYADWSRAEEADINTYRIGGYYSINELFGFTLEYALDEGPAGADIDNIGVRLTAAF